MSLTPHWYSTIFGVYFFAGCVLGFFALMTVLAFLVQSAGALRRTITTEHYHDLGKLVFAFTVFWAYIAFSQYMLMWYANLPEETFWYAARQAGSWMWWSLVLLFGHFLVPFLALMSRERQAPQAAARRGLRAGCSLMQWADVYWLVMPGKSPGTVPLSLMDVARLPGDRRVVLRGGGAPPRRASAGRAEGPSALGVAWDSRTSDGQGAGVERKRAARVPGRPAGSRRADDRHGGDRRDDPRHRRPSCSSKGSTRACNRSEFQTEGRRRGARASSRDLRAAQLRGSHATGWVDKQTRHRRDPDREGDGASRRRPEPGGRSSCPRRPRRERRADVES